MAVRVVTYNLLVPLLAEEPGYYSKSRPEFLTIDYRWRLIRSQLEQEIRSNQNTIICLQEVCRSLQPILKSFFDQMNYTLFDVLYGERHNDFMGVAVAVPRPMRVTSRNSVRVGDYLRSTFESRQKRSSLPARRNYPMNAIAGTWKRPSTDSWETAMSMSNTLLCVGVLVHGRPLLVGTYHMPCMFRQPDVMVMHASAVKDLVFQFAAGHPFVLAGDFNFKPRDAPYRVITERSYAEQLTLAQTGGERVSDLFSTQQVLRSAYREKNGAEPNYTNFAVTRQSLAFCATLDYIFFSGRLGVDHVLRLPARPTGRSYPDRTHPSDHLMIAASLLLY